MSDYEVARLVTVVDANITPLQRKLARAQAVQQQAAQQADRAGEAYGRMGSKMSAVDGLARKAASGVRVLERATLATAKAAGVALVGGIGYAIKKAADFEQQLSRLKAVTAGNRVQMGLLRAQALKYGAATKYSALEAAQAQTELAKGGLKTGQILRGGLKSALALAAAGEMELADAASTTANAMQLFNLKGRATMKVADALAMAANSTTADVKDFAMALKMGGSVAKMAGASFTETVTVLEALAKAGIKNSDAGTSLKSFFLNIATPSAKAKEAMEGLGMSIFDAQGNLKPLPALSENLRQSFGKLTKQQFLEKAGTIAGSDAIRTLYALYSAGPRTLAGYQKGLEKNGTAAQNARTKQDNLKGSLEQLQGATETLAITVGDDLLPALTAGSKTVTKFVNDVNRIAARDDLDLGQKLSLSMKAADRDLGPLVDSIGDKLQAANLDDKLGKGIGKLTTLLVTESAEAAPKAAKAFAEAFMASNALGKLAIGAWLVSKTGGLRGGLGGSGGGGLGGMASKASPIPVFVVNQGLGGGKGTPVPTGAPGGKVGTLGKIGRASKWVPLLGTEGTIVAFAALGQYELTKAAFKGHKGDPRATGEKPDRLLNPPGRHQRELGAPMLGSNAKRPSESNVAATLGRGAEFEHLGQRLRDTQREFENTKVRGGAAVKALNHDVASNFQAIKRELGVNSTSGALLVERNFNMAGRAIVKAINDGKVGAATGLKALRRLMDSETAGGRKASRQNMLGLVGDIQHLMSSGAVAAEKGAEAINAIMLRYLASFGIKGKVAVNLVGAYNPSQIGRMTSGDTREQGVPGAHTKAHGYAQGGLVQFGAPGAAGRDNIPVDFGGHKIVVGAGEQGIVATRHQQAGLNQMASAFGFAGLKGYLASENTPNYMARGGTIPRQKVSGPGPVAAMSQRTLDVLRKGAQKKVDAKRRKVEAAKAAVALGGGKGSLGAVTALAQKLGLTVTSTTGGQHAPGSYHYQGRAIDFSNSTAPTPEMMAFAQAVAKRYGSKVTELFYDPLGWSIKNGQRVGWTVGGHSNHVHVAMAKGGLVGKGFARGGGLGSLNRTFPEHGLSDTAGKAFIKFDTWRRIFESKGATPAEAYKFATIARGEGGGGRMGAYPGIRGDDPGGTKGRGGIQLTPGTWSKSSKTYKLMQKLGGEDALRNPFVTAEVGLSLLREGGWGNWYGTKYMQEAPAGLESALTKGDRAWMAGGGPKGSRQPSGKMLAGYQHSFTKKSQRLAWVNEQLERGDLKKSKRRDLLSERKSLKGSLRNLKGKLGEMTPTKGRVALGYDERMSVIDRGLAKAENTPRKTDDAKLHARRLSQLVDHQRDRQKRLRKINHALKGRLPPETRQRLLSERGGILSELASIPGQANASLEALRDAGPAYNSVAKIYAKRLGQKVPTSDDRPTKTDYLDRDLALARLTPDLGDDLSALTKAQGYWQGELSKAMGTADPRDDTEAAGSLASVNEEIKSLREEMSGLKDIEAQRLEVDRELVKNQADLKRLTETQGNALQGAMAAMVNGYIGGKAGLGRLTPSFPGSRGLVRF